MIQDVLTKIQTVLQAQMPAKLLAINTARITSTPDIVDWYTYPADADRVMRYPSCFVEAENTTGANQVARWRQLTHSIIIAIEHRNAQEDVLEKELQNYVEAIEKIIAADPKLQNTVENSEITNHSYSETAREESEMPWMKAVVIRLNAVERYQP